MRFRSWEMPLALRRSALAISIGAAAFALLAFVIYESSRLVGEPFPGFLTWDNGTLVAFHGSDWSGVDSGLPVRDGRVLAVDGEPFRDGRALLERARTVPLGTPITYRVLANGGEESVQVKTMRLTPGRYLETFGIYLAGAAVFFLMAVVVVYLQPLRSDARALAVLLILVGALFALAVDMFAGFRLVRLCLLVESATPVAAIQLALVFPSERLRASRRHLVVAFLLAVALALGWANGNYFYAAPDASRNLTYGVYLALAVSVIALALSLGWALVRATQPVERMRAAIVCSGAAVSCLLPASAVFAFFLLGWDFSFTWISAFIVFFPISIAYAVLRYNLLEAERFIRLSLGYSAATATAVVVYAGALLFADSLFGPASSQSPAAALLFIVVLVALFDPVRSRVQRAIDRYFFRTQVNVGQTLEASGAELVHRHRAPEILAYAEETLSQALGLAWVRVRTDASVPAEGALSERLRFGNQDLGVIACGAKKSGAPFSAAEHELVRGMASQVALALRNARAMDDLRTAQSALVQAERLAAVGEVAGSVAHGIRNPLAGIRASAQVAQEQATSPELRRILGDVLQESDRLEQRIRTLLDFSRPLDPAVRTIELGELFERLETSVSHQAERQNVDFRVGTETHPFSLDTDPDFLAEVLLELIGNAFRALPDGGRIEVSGKREAGRTVLTVSDSGPGVPESHRERLFDLFFTTRPEGTGVGLATAKKIVSRLGGSIVCEPGVGSGTRFRIALP